MVTPTMAYSRSGRCDEDRLGRMKKRTRRAATQLLRGRLAGVTCERRYLGGGLHYSAIPCSLFFCSPPLHRQKAPLLTERDATKPHALGGGDAQIVAGIDPDARRGVVQTGLHAEGHVLFERRVVAQRDERWLVPDVELTLSMSRPVVDVLLLSTVALQPSRSTAPLISVTIRIDAVVSGL